MILTKDGDVTFDYITFNFISSVLILVASSSAAVPASYSSSESLIFQVPSLLS